MRRSIVLPQYYELRECGRCVDGRIYEPVGPTESPCLVPCPTCAGTGCVCVPVPEASAAAETVLMVRSLPSLGGGAGIVLNVLQMVSNERNRR